jgi:pimeloyl-ACP methyl ester carboxylesterase
VKPPREPKASGFLEDGELRIWWELHDTGGVSPNGAAPREVVCLLNGLAMHTKAWFPFLDDLEGYDVLLYDYVGQGASSSPDEPITLPRIAGHLRSILDLQGIDRIHVLGVSYGGFVALEFARLFQERLHTLTLSGIHLSHERVFELYQAMSLRLYAGGRDLFPLYTHYLYEKIFGERFLQETPPETLESMRQRFEDRYIHRIHSLVRLTEAQNPFFGELDRHLPQYRSVRTPTLVLSGAQDRCVPLWAQEKLVDVFANSRYELIADAGHVVYMERREVFFPRWRRFMETRNPTA